MAKRIRAKVRDVRVRSRLLPMLASIGHDCRPLIGPQQVMVDFNNNCNLHCLCCFNYSPLSPCPLTREERMLSFPAEAFLRLVDDCARMGVSYINLAGYGEPLMHPECGRLLEAMRRRGLRGFVTTNGTLLYRFPQAVRLLRGAAISIHAGSPEVYARMHPRDPKSSWEHLIQGLELLRRYSIPSTICYVICTENWEDLESAVDLAGTCGADLDVQPIRPFIRQEAGRPEFDPVREGELSLTEWHLERLRERRTDLERRVRERGVKLHGIRELLEIRRDNRGDCAGGDCNSGGDATKIGGFYDTHPCYTGWYFARVLLDGTVTACCQCVGGITFGNIREHSFAEIWDSDAYRWFRNETLRAPLRDSRIWNCCACEYCNSVGKNRRIYEQLAGSGPISRLLRMAHPLVRRRAGNGIGAEPALLPNPGIAHEG